MKKILYLGTDSTHFKGEGEIIHYPVIQIVPRSPFSQEIKQAYAKLDEFTHLIFTSKNAVQVFFSHLNALQMDPNKIKQKSIIAVGDVTALLLNQKGISVDQIADPPTQEGIIECIKDLKKPYIFLPKSSISREVLQQFFIEKHLRYETIDLYDTISLKQEPVPDLQSFDQIVFTSPSTVKGFLEIYKTIPKEIECIAIGPITEKALLIARDFT